MEGCVFGVDAWMMVQEGLSRLFQLGNFNVYCNESRLLYSYGTGTYGYSSGGDLVGGYLDGGEIYSLPASSW